MFVGVDAALSPAMRNCKIARIFGENVKRPVGADDPVRPWDNDNFATTFRKNGHALCGSMWASTPTNMVRIRMGAFVFVGAYRRADRVVRPYRDVTWSPILRAALRLRVAGSMWASTPTDISCIRRSLCGFVAAPCAGGVEPRPYGSAGGNFIKSPACYFAANPVK